MAKLDTDLKEWVAQSLLTEEQARKIQVYESSKTHTSWIMSGLLILGALIIGIGVISLIAANWSNIPDGVKLALDLLILVTLAAAAVHAERSGKAVVFEVLLVSLQLMTLASIGLISQIYNTGGKAHQALFFWSFATLGLALVSKQFFVPFLWSGLLMAGISAAGFESEMMRLLFARDAETIIALNPFFAAVIAGILARLGVSAGLTRAFRWWILYAGLVVLVILEFASGYSYRSVGTTIYALLYGSAFLVAIDIFTSREFRKMQRGLLLALLLSFVVACLLPTSGDRSGLAQGAATIFVLSFAGIFMASLHARGLFQLMVSLIGIRFLVLYFQAFGGLATTGFGLIISGIFVIGTAILWNKYRNKLTVWAEGWTR